MNFGGTGILKVNALEKEGIESKMNVTIDGGTYIIKSLMMELMLVQKEKVL